MTDSVMDVLKSLKIPVAEYEDVDYLPTGSLLVDRALGGGIPRSRWTLAQGVNGFGKTTLALLACAETIRNGGRAVYFDVENAFNAKWAEKLGVDLSSPNFQLVQYPAFDKQGKVFGYAERILNDVRKLIQSDVIDLIVVDSLYALTPRVKFEKEDLDNTGVQFSPLATFLSKMFYPVVTPDLKASRTAVLQINQARENLANASGHGDPYVFPGGRAKEFYSSITLRMTQSPEKLKVKEEVVGLTFKGTTTKNKTAPPFRDFTFTVFFEAGFSKVQEIFTLAKDLGVLRNRSGEVYARGIAAYRNIELGGSEAEIKTYLDSHPNIAAELEADIRITMKGTSNGQQPTDPDDSAVFQDAE